MHSSGSAPAHRSALRVGGLVMTAIAAWLSVSDLAAQTATAQTAKQRFESAQERDEQVRVLLTNFTNTTPPADLVKQVSQVMSSFESIVPRRSNPVMRSRPATCVSIVSGSGQTAPQAIFAASAW